MQPGRSTQFTDGNLIRELVQNSLDAGLGFRPVLVELKVHDLPIRDIDGDGLATAIRRCAASKYVTTDDADRRLREGLERLTGGTV